MLSSASEIRKSNKRQKTDKKDAQWIADLFKHDLVNGSLIPPKDIRQLRDLCRYWVKLSSDTTGKKNRAQNCLTVWSYVKKKYKLNVTNFPFFVIVNSLSLLGPFPSFSDIVPHIHLETNIHNDYEYGLYYRMFQYIQKLVYMHECS